MHLYQHRFVGVVGQHKDFGIENMAVSGDGKFLASCAMDEVVRFWNIDYLYNTTVDNRRKVIDTPVFGVLCCVINGLAV